MDKIVTSREKFDKIKRIIYRQDLQEISFDFIVGSLFPDIYDNIKQRLKFAHAQGYMDGLNDAGVVSIEFKDGEKSFKYDDGAPVNN